MKQTDSRECRNCHGIEFMLQETQTAAASMMHSLAGIWGKTCIDCHKGIAHSLPWNYDQEALMDELHELVELDKIECRLCHTDMAGKKRRNDW